MGPVSTPTPQYDYTEYHEAFPRTEGPPPVSAGTYEAAFSDKGEDVAIYMDPGAFRAMWELTEAEAKKRWGATTPSAKAYARAVKALREAWLRRVAAGTPPLAPADAS